MSTQAGTRGAPTQPNPGGQRAGRAVGAGTDESFSQRLVAYLWLTKPRIIELLLVTTIPAMVVAADGWPGTWLVVATLVGGTLSAGSANTFNNYLDRDIDRVMERTRRRPIVRETVTPRAALLFGVVLGIAGFIWLAVLVNLLAALLSTAATLFYVFVYTLGMKRRTNQAVVIGGAAGCVPVLVGWAAVTGTVELPALGLFAIVFYWTPPHFWSLAMRYRDDYRAARLPILPVTHGNEEATRHILLYSYLLVAVTAIYGAMVTAGLVYVIGVVIADGVWLYLAHRLRRLPTERGAMRLFHYSTGYLAAVFALAAVDAVLT